MPRLVNEPVGPDGCAPKVFLVGMMGAGKTTIGRILASRLGCIYLDSDEMVEAATGRSVAELWRFEGEARFREEESRSLEAAVGSKEPCVVSVAGGAVLDPGNRSLLAGAGRVVWLRAEVRTLAQRVGAGEGHRPLLAGDPEGNLRRLYEVRRPIYESVADAVVDVDALGPEEVADAVLVELGTAGRTPAT